MVIAVIALGPTVLPDWWGVVGWIGNVFSGIMGAGQIINFILEVFGI
jgi:hypothetical protein